jgi:hypothetical protein
MVKTVTILKYWKLKMVVWSMVLWNDVEVCVVDYDPFGE